MCLCVRACPIFLMFLKKTSWAFTLHLAYCPVFFLRCKRVYFRIIVDASVVVPSERACALPNLNGFIGI